jgi:hypothetical protein
VAKKRAFKVRRTVKACAKLCKGLKGTGYKRCFSTCISEAQKGTKKGKARIAKGSPTKPVGKLAASCCTVSKNCLRKNARKFLRTPKTRERK